MASEQREGKWSAYSKDEAAGRKAPVAQVLPQGQPLVYHLDDFLNNHPDSTFRDFFHVTARF